MVSCLMDFHELSLKAEALSEIAEVSIVIAIEAPDARIVLANLWALHLWCLRCRLSRYIQPIQ
ncbi:MAG: hypothetical protein Ct9H90mP16_01890 [Candidatus Poseidoniales archaeon]|nr:MAG: hypothetical protein Ct9H90mP16_01890 [Candidatus Poseidoniales archaeon]